MKWRMKEDEVIVSLRLGSLVMACGERSLSYLVIEVKFSNNEVNIYTHLAIKMPSMHAKDN